MVSAIIPVYNEAPRVAKVLDAVIGHALVDEVIVINDGSSDDSEAVLKARPSIRLISYRPNRGKSHAALMGLRAAKNELVMILDADLLGLTPRNITDLIEPVAAGDADMSLTLRQNSLHIYRFFGLDFVSGERVFHKYIIRDLETLGRLPGYGLESFLNEIVVQKKMRLKVVRWDNVICPRKSAKVGWWAGTTADFQMVWSIISYLSLPGVIKVFLAMRRQKIK